MLFVILISVPFEIPLRIPFEFPTENSTDDSMDAFLAKRTYHCRLTDVYCLQRMSKLRQKIKSQSVKAKQTIEQNKKVQSQPKKLSPLQLYRLFQVFREMDKVKLTRG